MVCVIIIAHIRRASVLVFLPLSAKEMIQFIKKEKKKKKRRKTGGKKEKKQGDGEKQGDICQLCPYDYPEINVKNVRKYWPSILKQHKI